MSSSVAVLTNIWFVDTGNKRLCWVTGAQNKATHYSSDHSFMIRNQKRSERSTDPDYRSLTVNDYLVSWALRVIQNTSDQVRYVRDLNYRIDLWMISWREKSLHCPRKSTCPSGFLRALLNTKHVKLFDFDTPLKSIAIVSWKRYQTNCFSRRPYGNLVKVPLF